MGGKAGAGVAEADDRGQPGGSEGAGVEGGSAGGDGRAGLLALHRRLPVRKRAGGGADVEPCPLRRLPRPPPTRQVLLPGPPSPRRPRLRTPALRVRTGRDLRPALPGRQHLPPPTRLRPRPPPPPPLLPQPPPRLAPQRRLPQAPRQLQALPRRPPELGRFRRRETRTLLTPLRDPSQLQGRSLILGQSQLREAARIPQSALPRSLKVQVQRNCRCPRCPACLATLCRLLSIFPSFRSQLRLPGGAAASSSKHIRVRPACQCFPDQLEGCPV